MLATKPWIYGKMANDSALIALLGSTDNITDAWPEVFTIFPMVIYTEDNQSDWEWRDNTPSGSDCRIKIDIFTKLDGPTTTNIGINIARIMGGLSFGCGKNGEVPDQTEGVRHRVMRFNRALVTSNI